VGRNRNPTREMDIAFAERPVRSRETPNSDAIRTQVDVGKVPERTGDLCDRRHETRTLLERSRAVVGVRAPIENTPVIDAPSVMERPSRGSTSLHLNLLEPRRLRSNPAQLGVRVQPFGVDS